MSEYIARKSIGKTIADRYSITRTIGAGAMGSVFEAISNEDPSHRVAIKVISRGKQLTADDLLMFQKEASLMSQLYHPNIVTFYELGLLGKEETDFGDGYYIVMELVHGKNLKDILQEEQQLTLPQFFSLAKQVASALDYIHGKGVIHRDIKPHNIVIENFQDSTQFQIKVLDFGVARQGETSHFTGEKNTGDIAGTPLYMAPELQGIFGEVIDHRIDLYSLGCMLFESLTGTPPFVDTTRQALMEKHASHIVPKIRNFNQNVPAIIEHIIEKLLEKDPSNRYQSVHSFIADLNRAEYRLTYLQEEQNFKLAQNNKFRSLFSSLPLIGRQDEYQKIISAYKDCTGKSGRSRITVIKGQKGVGKSRLLAEIQQYFKEEKVRFISAQFSQHETSLPLNTLANAFNEYLLRIYKSQPIDRDNLIYKFRSNLGTDGHRLATIIPGLDPYISNIPRSDADLSFNEQNFSSFVKVFSDFTRCLVSNDEPVVLIFDSLHWADDKSLELIDIFFSHNNSQRLFMIVSYDDNVNLESQKSKEFLSKFSKLKRRYQEIELDFLRREDIKKIAKDIFNASCELDDSLTNLFYEQCHGNVLYLAEYIKQLVEKDYIAPDLTSKFGWHFNLAKIQSFNFSLNNVDLALSSLGKYNKSEKQILEIAATTGLIFHFETLLLQDEIDSLYVSKVLKRAIEDGLIINLQNQLNNSNFGKSYRFKHKKTKDELYRSIDAEKKAEYHYAIAEIIEKNSVDKDGRIAFSLAHHFSKALTNNSSLELHKKNFEYLLLSGEHAASHEGYATAEKYFEKALELINSTKMPIAKPYLKPWLIEKIADQAAYQNKQSKAVKSYQSLLQMQLPDVKEARIVDKILSFQINAGIVSESKKLLHSTLLKLDDKFFKYITFYRYSYIILIVIDYICFKLGISLFKSLMLRAYKLRKQNIPTTEKSDIKIRLLNKGQLISLADNPQDFLNYHAMGLAECIKNNPSTEATLQTLTNHSALLYLFGFEQQSLQYLNTCQQYSEKFSIKNINGLRSFFLSSIHYYTKNNVKKSYEHTLNVINHLSLDEFKLYIDHANILRSYIMLLRCNKDHLHAIAENSLRAIATRSWLGPRLVSIILFEHLMSGEKTKIVAKAEPYLTKRLSVFSRMDSLNSLVIRLFLDFAKGNLEKTKKLYLKTCSEYLKEDRSELLFPYEDDFILLTLLAIPDFYYTETGEDIIPQGKYFTVLDKIKTYLKHTQSKRNEIVYKLTLAKISKIKNEEQCLDILDELLQEIDQEQYKLIYLLALSWKCLYLFDKGEDQKSILYLNEILDSSKQLGLNAIINYVTTSLKNRGYTDHLQLPIQNSICESIFTQYPSTLAIEHFKLLSSAAVSEMSIQKVLNESIQLLKTHYGQNIYCIFHTKNNLVTKIQCGDGDSEKYDQTMTFCKPYIDMNIVLFMPADNLPWKNSKKLQTVQTSFHEELATLPHGINPLGATVRHIDENLDQTSMVHQTIKGTFSDALDQHTKVNQNSNDTNAHNTELSAIIPINYEQENFGVILIESTYPLTMRHNAMSKKELERFGLQLGYLLQRKVSEQISKSEFFRYKKGLHRFETNNWLKLWHHDEPCLDNENTWGLGFNVSADQYFLIHFWGQGKVISRELLSNLIWNYANCIKSQAKTNNQPLSFDELRFDLSYLLKSIPEVSTLDKLSLTFSLFSSENHTVLSGQFGKMRPYALAGKNRIKPTDEILLSLNNGGEIRFWQINSDLKEGMPLIVSLESHERLEQVSKKLTVDVMQKFAMLQSSQDLHVAFSEHILRNGTSLRYTAAVLVTKEEYLDLAEAK